MAWRGQKSYRADSKNCALTGRLSSNDLPDPQGIQSLCRTVQNPLLVNHWWIHVSRTRLDAIQSNFWFEGKADTGLKNVAPKIWLLFDHNLSSASSCNPYLGTAPLSSHLRFIRRWGALSHQWRSRQPHPILHHPTQKPFSSHSPLKFWLRLSFWGHKLGWKI